MTQNTPASNDIASAAATKTNWLAAFNGALGGQSGRGLFDSLLGELDHLAAMVKDAGNASAAPKSAVKPEAGASAQTADQGGLQNVAAEVSQFAYQWHRALQTEAHMQNKADDNHATNSDNKKAADKTDAATQKQPDNAATATTIVSAQPVPQITSSNTDTSGNNPATGNPDLNSLIATMQALLQNLQAAQKGASPAAQDATPTTGNTGSLQDAGAMLLGLLKLAQKTAGQLATLTDNATPAAASATPALDSGFLKDLKNLVDQFQTVAQAATQDTTATTTTTPLNNLPTADAAAAQTTPASASGLMQAALGSADRLMQQIQQAITGQNVAAQSASSQGTAALADTSAVSASALQNTPALGFTDVVFTPSAVAATNGDAHANSDWTMNQGNNNAAATQVGTGAAPVSADGLRSTSTYSFASQLSSARGTMPATLPAAVEQAMVQMSRNIKSGNDQMTLQLRPAELGQINIKLNIASDGSVTGTVVASHQATLDLLTKDRSGLERALQDAGLSADSSSLQFSLGGQQGQEANQFAQNGQTQNNAGGSNTLPVDVAANDMDEPDSWIVTPGRVNLKV